MAEILPILSKTLSNQSINQIGGKQQESKQHIKFHMSSKFISNHFLCRILLNFET